MNEEDKRVIRTRKRLAAALIELSREEGYDAVTIQALTDRAGINYRTFFRHYDGKDELLQDVLHNALADLQKVLQPPSPSEFRDEDFAEMARNNGRALYEYVGANRDLFIVLLQSGPAALESIQRLAREEAKEFITPLPASTIPHELVANHMVAASFSSIQWWLDNDMPYTPQQMGDYAAQLIMLPVRRLLLQESSEVVR